MAIVPSWHSFYKYTGSLKKLSFFSLLAVVLLFNTSTTKAANITWTGLTNTNWNVATNWSGGVVPVAADNVTIPFTINKPTVNVTSACATLTISGATTLTMSTALNVSGAISIGASATIAGTSTLSGGSLTFTAATTLTLNSAMSISGAISTGTATTIAGTSTLSGGSLTFTAATTLTLNRPVNISGAISTGTATTIAGTSTLSGGSLTFTAATTLTVNTPVNISGAVSTGYATTVAGSSTLSGGSLTFTAATTLTVNTPVNISGAVSTGYATTVAGSSTLSGGSLTFTAAITLTLSTPINISGDINTSFAATIAGSSTLSGGSLTFTAATTFTLNTPINISGRVYINFNTIIGGTSTLIAYDSVLSASSSLTLNTSATFAGLVGITSNTASTITIASGKILQAFGYAIGGSQSTTLNLAGAGTSSLSGITFFNYQSILTVAAASTLNFSAGSTLSMTNNAPNSPTSFLNNSGTINFNGTSASNINVNNYYGEIYTNTGTINLTYTNFTFGGGNSRIDNKGIFNATSCTFTLANPSYISNSTTSGKFDLTACTVTLPQGSYITNTATLPGYVQIDGGSTINFGYGAYINNSGLFYGGASASAATFNVNSQTAYITNTGTFNLGSTSVINLTGTSSYLQNSSGTFTLQSDANGTGAIGNISGSGAYTSGQFTVQRYFTGGSLSNRGYRLMSSPINNSNNTVPTPASNIYNFTTNPSLNSSIIITGPGGSGNGWYPGASATSVTILNYSTATQLFASPATLAGASGAVGTGFYFFYRGDKISNLGTKLVKSGTYAIPESVVASQTGYLNQGSITVNLNYVGTNGFNLLGNPYASTIDLTGVNAGNVLYDAWMYDRTNNTCQPYDYVSATSPDPNITKYLASGEGFFVKATGTGGFVTFQESAKNTTAANQQTGSKLLMGIPKQMADGRIRLKLQQDSANADFAMLLFNDSYNAKYDADEDVDDMSAAGQTVLLSSLTADNTPVAINKLPLGKQKTSSFLAVDAGAGGRFIFSKVDVTNISTAYDVWLVDHFAKDSLNLRTNNNYTFTIDKGNAATFGNTRFEVVIRKQVLPSYQLLTFTGQRANNANVLNWTTINEYAYTTFTVQSSIDGKNFMSIGTVQSDSTGKYTYTDKNAKTSIFYRLMQSDINDAVTYSNIIFIDLTANIFSLYPNPATNNIQFKLDKEVRSSVSLRVFNSTGTQVKLSTYTQNSGSQDVSLLAPGIYTILLFDNSTRQTVASGKFVKI